MERQYDMLVAIASKTSFFGVSEAIALTLLQ
jgi:hypothetical protein